MRPSLGVNSIDGSDFTVGAFFMDELGSGSNTGPSLTGIALLMGALVSYLIPASRFTAGSRFMAGSFLTGVGRALIALIALIVSVQAYLLVFAPFISVSELG